MRASFSRIVPIVQIPLRRDCSVEHLDAEQGHKAKSGAIGKSAGYSAVVGGAHSPTLERHRLASSNGATSPSDEGLRC